MNGRHLSSLQKKTVQFCLFCNMHPRGKSNRLHDPWESEFPASRTLYSRFQPPSLVLSTFMCFSCCEKLHNVAKFISYFSRVPACLQFSFLPPPLNFPPPLLPDFCLPAPLHTLASGLGYSKTVRTILNTAF